MRKPHKHAVQIHAFANGAEIEERYKYKAAKSADGAELKYAGWRSKREDGAWQTAEGYEYRVKPEYLKYRVAHLIDKNGSHYTLTDNCCPTEVSIECTLGFIEWLGDWQEVEVLS